MEDFVKQALVDNLRDPVWYTETMWKRGLSGFPPAIITCAITGGNQGKEANPNLPCTIEEQVESTYEAYKAGAVMVHIHTREPDNLNVMSHNPELYREVNAKIREKCPDLIINNTNICGRWINVDEKMVGDRMESITEAGAEVGSIDISCYCSQIPMKAQPPEHPEPWVKENGYFITPNDVVHSLDKMKEYGVKPEFECFAMTDLHYIRRLINQGWTDGTGGPNWASFVYTLGSNWNLPQFMDMLMMACPRNTLLNIIAAGPQQFAVLTQALIHGFSVRVGMEDNVFYGKGKKADSNAQLVEKICQIADLLERPRATCEQARAMLGIGAPRKFEWKK